MRHVSDLVSEIDIRVDAKWQNGDDFVAKDVEAFYYLNHTTATNYMISVEAVNEKLVRITWNAKRLPSNQVKELLVAQDRHGTVQYNEFKVYADTAKAIVLASPDIAENATTWGAFNKFSTTAQISQLERNYTAFRNYEPAWFVCTGPYRLSLFSATQLVLVKAETHYALNTIGFDKIEVYSSSDLNTTYGFLANGTIDYQDGMANVTVMETLLSKNKNLVHLKMYDPGAIGIIFNLEKPLWSDKVREAFQYLFNREEMKNAGNPYAITSYFALSGIAPSEAMKWMTSEHFGQITTYSYNEARATELLIEAGWNKVGGTWRQPGGAPIELQMGFNSSHPGQKDVANAAAAALNAFGIPTVLKAAGDHGLWYQAATAENSIYDLSVAWTDLNMSFGFPTGSYKQFSNDMSKVVHLPRYAVDYSVGGEKSPLAGQLQLAFDDLNGGTVEFAQMIDIFYSLSGDDLSHLVGAFTLGISRLNLGIQFYQNVTGSFVNSGYVDGIPMETYWRENRNVTYVPQYGTPEFYAVARTNMHFAGMVNILQGVYQPTVKE
jgi:peptide/nickel transport system substrate-binding protein